MAVTCLRNGTIYDPANGVDGCVRDLWICDGRLIDGTGLVADRVIDLTGLIVMPGGIDLHAHIAGPKVNVARKFRPEDRRNNPPHFATHLRRSGTAGSTPTTFVTGYLYAGMGYTTVFDAAIPPLGARHTHEEFHDTPVIDKGFFVLTGNNQYALEQIAANESERLKHFCGYLLNATGGYALKCVNPGGVETWKRSQDGLIDLDDAVAGYDLTPRKILKALTKTADELMLPHPLHIHSNRLGLPGNWKTTLNTMAALEGNRGHLTHIQFHSYGGDADDQGTFCSKVTQLAEFVNTHANLTVDVGQVMFGETTSMTGDGPLGHYLHRVTGRKWFNGETECEAGCGIVPIEYREKSVVHALQWAIGLEWYLLVNDPWRIAMTTDHPNGAAFVSYPQIIALLMSRDYRREVLKRLPPSLIGRCVLPDLQREYSLYEIAIVTRAGPARLLGLKHKGHLGVGGDADVTVYTPGSDLKAMFEMPRYVFKAGEIVVEHGEIRSVPYGPTIIHRPEYDPSIESHLKPWFEKHYSIQFANFPVSEHYFSRGVR